MATITAIVEQMHRTLKWLTCMLIRAYRLLLSPLLGWHCRFYPTCSSYALLAYQQYGWLQASKLTLLRLLKCHPWHAGGLDELPKPTLPKPSEVNLCKPNNAD